MRCSDVEKYLQAYIDGEFAEDDLDEIRDHFKFCPSCREKVRFETWFKAGLKNSVVPVQAPISLQASINRSFRKEHLRETPVAYKLAPAVAIMLIFLGVYFMPRIDVRAPIVEATVESHVQSPPAEVQSDDYAHVRKYFQSKMKYGLKIPRFQKQNLFLKGGRVAYVSNHAMAHLIYQGNGKRLSLFAAPKREAGGLLPQEMQQLIDNKELLVTRYNGFNVVLWQSDGVIYSLAGDEDESHLVRLVADVDYGI